MSESKSSMRSVWLVTLGHTAIDFYMVTIPPLYAVFRDHFDLSVFQISFLPAFVTVFGSISQPLMGTFTDHRNRFAWAALGVLVCGLFVSFVGFASSVHVLAAMLIGASLGSSLFHPTAGGLVTSLVPGRTNLTMAIFLTGGTTGMALAPLAGTQIVDRYGLESLWMIIPICVPAATALLWTSRHYRIDDSAERRPRLDWRELRNPIMKPLWTLYSISVLRSLVHSGFISFTAILGSTRGWETTRIGWVLSGYLVCSTLGRMLGGYLADRVSARRLLALSNASSAIFHVAFCVIAVDWSVAFFWIAGLLFDLGVTTNIVLAQKALPQNTSTATGLVMGFSWGTAGLAIPLVGAFAQATSVPLALGIVSLALVLATFLVSRLPRDTSELEPVLSS